MGREHRASRVLPRGMKITPRSRIDGFAAHLEDFARAHPAIKHDGQDVLEWRIGRGVVLTPGLESELKTLRASASCVVRQPAPLEGTETLPREDLDRGYKQLLYVKKGS